MMDTFSLHSSVYENLLAFHFQQILLLTPVSVLQDKTCRVTRLRKRQAQRLCWSHTPQPTAGKQRWLQ